jgi:hypothetical protein
MKPSSPAKRKHKKARRGIERCRETQAMERDFSGIGIERIPEALANLIRVRRLTETPGFIGNLISLTHCKMRHLYNIYPYLQSFSYKIVDKIAKCCYSISRFFSLGTSFPKYISREPKGAVMMYLHFTPPPR